MGEHILRITKADEEGWQTIVFVEGDDGLAGDREPCNPKSPDLSGSMELGIPGEAESSSEVLQ